MSDNPEKCGECGCPVTRGGVPRLQTWWVMHDCDVSDPAHWHQHAPLVDEGFYERVSERMRLAFQTEVTGSGTGQ